MNRWHARRGAFVAILLLGAAIVLIGQTYAASGVPRGEGFASKDAAVKALAEAARTHDVAALTKILGTDAKTVISSGDEVADKAVGARIAAAYDQMHRFATVGDGRVIIYLGADNWPMPIPLIERHGKWYF